MLDGNLAASWVDGVMGLVDPFVDVLSFTARTNTRTAVPANTRFIFEVTDLRCDGGSEISYQ